MRLVAGLIRRGLSTDEDGKLPIEARQLFAVTTYLAKSVSACVDQWLPRSPAIPYPIYNIRSTDRSNLIHSDDDQVRTMYQVDFTDFYTNDTDRPAMIYDENPIEVRSLVNLAQKEVTRLLLPFRKGGMVMAEKVLTLFTLLLDDNDIGADVDCTSWSKKSLFRIFKQTRDMVGILENVTPTDQRLREMLARHTTLLSISLLHSRPAVALLAHLADLHYTQSKLIREPPAYFQLHVSLVQDLAFSLPSAFVVSTGSFHVPGPYFDVTGSKTQVIMNTVSWYGGTASWYGELVRRHGD